MLCKAPMKDDNSSITNLLETEQRNERTQNMDALDTDALVRLLFEETVDVRNAIESTLPRLTELISVVAGSINNGGRLIYIGAGTSGRLGVLDASECAPTFSVPAGTVLGLIAGGNSALTEAVEGAEDDETAGSDSVLNLNVNSKDVLIGIASSGKTPYVMGALKRARMLGATTAVIVNVNESPLRAYADFYIAAITGPEPLTGSTRMRAGTAQKLILNLISTSVMVKNGRVFGNLMVDVHASNVKLRDRAVRIVAAAAHVTHSDAQKALGLCNWRCKPAIIMLAAGISAHGAETALNAHGGNIRACLHSILGDAAAQL